MAHMIKLIISCNSYQKLHLFYSLLLRGSYPNAVIIRFQSVIAIMSSCSMLHVSSTIIERIRGVELVRISKVPVGHY